MGHMEARQKSLRISQVDVVNPSPSHVSGACHKLLEAEFAKDCGEETLGILVQTDVHIPRYDCQFLHVHKLL